MTWHLIDEINKGIHDIKWIPLYESNEQQPNNADEVKRTNQTKPAQQNLQQLGKANIARTLQQLKQSVHVNALLDAFIGRDNIPMRIQVKNEYITVFLQQGTRAYGARKIAYKHLIDGLTASTGGFTLKELNDALPVLSKTKAMVDNKGMNVKRVINGIQWLIGIRRSGRNKWTISTICTNRNQIATRKLVKAAIEKCSGPIIGRNQKSNHPNSQPSD